MLPKIALPKFEITLPISEQKVVFRPFLMKEQKILLMAKESEEQYLYDSLKDIVKNCCYTQIDVDNLSIVDIEYFFLQLRAKSVGEIIETQYRCYNAIDDTPCKNLMDVAYDISSFPVIKSEISDIIKINDDIGIKMKPPTYELIKYENLDNVEYMKGCIDYIYDADNIYQKKDIPKDELDEFVENLSLKNLNDIKKFLDDLPRIDKTIKFICKKCGYEHVISPKGIISFFV